MDVRKVSRGQLRAIGECQVEERHDAVDKLDAGKRVTNAKECTSGDADHDDDPICSEAQICGGGWRGGARLAALDRSAVRRERRRGRPVPMHGGRFTAVGRPPLCEGAAQGSVTQPIALICGSTLRRHMLNARVNKTALAGARGLWRPAEVRLDVCGIGVERGHLGGRARCELRLCAREAAIGVEARLVPQRVQLHGVEDGLYREEARGACGVRIVGGGASPRLRAWQRRQACLVEATCAVVQLARRTRLRSKRVPAVECSMKGEEARDRCGANARDGGREARGDVVSVDVSGETTR